MSLDPAFYFQPVGAPTAVEVPLGSVSSAVEDLTHVGPNVINPFGEVYAVRFGQIRTLEVGATIAPTDPGLPLMRALWSHLVGGGACAFTLNRRRSWASTFSPVAGGALSVGGLLNPWATWAGPGNVPRAGDLVAFDDAWTSTIGEELTVAAAGLGALSFSLPTVFPHPSGLLRSVGFWPALKLSPAPGFLVSVNGLSWELRARFIYDPALAVIMAAGVPSLR